MYNNYLQVKVGKKVQIYTGKNFGFQFLNTVFVKRSKTLNAKIENLHKNPDLLYKDIVQEKIVIVKSSKILDLKKHTIFTPVKLH